MVVMGDGDELNVFDLPASLQNEALESWGSAPQPDAPKYTEASPKQTHQTDLEALLPRRVLPLKEAMRLMERLYLEQTLLKYDNIKDASDALEVHFSTLWRKMIQYNIDNNKKMRNIK
jgi:DNA-binding NtrC family response regulator